MKLGGGAPDVLIPGAIGQSYTASQSGNYYVVVTDQTGCQGTSVLIEHTYNAIQELGNAFSYWNIYPNPAKDLLTIELGMFAPSGVIFSIFNTNGQTVRTFDLGVQNKDLVKAIRVDELAEGLYSIVVKTGQGILRSSFVKQ
jgi:hypothetical protein